MAYLSKLYFNRVWKKILIPLVMLVIMFIVLISVSTNIQIKTNIFPRNADENVMQSSNKSILYWNNFFRWNDMGLGLGHKIFENCSINTCFTTNNKSYMPVENFDAIIMHMARFNLKKDGLPKVRSPHQKYIFYSLESAVNTWYPKTINKKYFNWTMSFRKDSDIHFPYALVHKTETGYKLPERIEIRNKTKKVAWFVSNCGSKTRRKYVDELSKYIPVDIYGRCGNLTCPRSENCYKMLEDTYKFYLSFENTMCKDYITEKMFHVLTYNVIPIVLGDGDYKTSAPPNSVINTKDFESPQHLAKYLWYLDENDDEYLKYFEWKKSFIVKNYDIQYVLCQLCLKLHKDLTYSSYDDVGQWFHGDKCVS